MKSSEPKDLVSHARVYNRRITAGADMTVAARVIPKYQIPRLGPALSMEGTKGECPRLGLKKILSEIAVGRQERETHSGSHALIL